MEGLHKVGYKTNYGEDGSGFLFLALKRAGGYYLGMNLYSTSPLFTFFNPFSSIDVGACQKIIDGKIKIKNGTQISGFTKTGLAFEDGSTVDADVVLYATGFSDARDPIRKIVSQEVGAQLPPIWGLDAEGELRGTWRELGTPGLWYMMGNLAWCRFFSKHVALRECGSLIHHLSHVSYFPFTEIKAKQEGVFGTRYSAPPE